MFENEYRRMNDGIHADEALIRRTLAALPKAQPTPRRRMLPLVAAAVCLMALLVVPHLLRQTPSTDVTSASATPAPADFTPVGHVTEFDGMTLRYLTSYSTAGSRYILLSLEGEPVSEEMGLHFALTSEKTGQGFWVGAKQLNHDAARQLSTFVVAFHEEYLTEYLPIELTGDSWRFPAQAYDPTLFRMLPEDDRLTLTVLEYQHILYESLEEELPLHALPTEAVTALHKADQIYHPMAEPQTGEAVLPVLTGGTTIQLFRDVRLSAGFDGESLRVQTRHAQPLSVSDLTVYLHLACGSLPDRPWQYFGIWEDVLSPDTLFDWTDEATGEYVREYRYTGIYPGDDAQLPFDDSWKLCAIGFQKVDLPDNSRTLTFTLGE